MDKFANLALEEYNSSDKTVRRAGNGKAFWNVNSSQFTFVPQLEFPEIPGARAYLFTATDSKNKTYTFEADSPIEPLTAIWKDLAPGFVSLKVEAIHRRGDEKILAGARTFWKCDPFPGRENLPPRARSYRECALLAFEYLFRDPTTQHWLKHGLPDPKYSHNVYPSKMISSVVKAMLSYAKMKPSCAESAIKLARNAADYLLSITYPDGTPLAGLPPTYSYKDLDREIVNRNIVAAKGREFNLMTIYPAFVGSMYLKLEKDTGEHKYFEAAKRIADYYAENVLPNGSWHLFLDVRTGEAIGNNCCQHFSILNFLSEYGDRTGEESWKEMARKYFSYISAQCLDGYNWEGQFEDVKLTSNYHNLTHLTADSMISYIAKNMSDDNSMIAIAEEIMRYVEDQFVVWGRHAPWNRSLEPGRIFHSPAALEQYEWYVPIDGSTGAVTRALIDLYSVTKNPLLLEKACALGDAITRMQDPESGVIPTHWMSKEPAKDLFDFWINCHIGTAFNMLYLADALGEE
ncbi:MAG: hypothetical protein E7587_05840 [Ruminococcaceae bacterium]|nr:hypothetical protein [Oscillospiraceae bacterium]